jgi:hypothetical protein
VLQPLVELQLAGETVQTDTKGSAKNPPPSNLRAKIKSSGSVRSSLGRPTLSGVAVCLLVQLASISTGSDQKPEPRMVHCSDIPARVHIVGKLGQPLGQLVTVRARWTASDPSKPALAPRTINKRPVHPDGGDLGSQDDAGTWWFCRGRLLRGRASPVQAEDRGDHDRQGAKRREKVHGCGEDGRPELLEKRDRPAIGDRGSLGIERKRTCPAFRPPDDATAWSSMPIAARMPPKTPNAITPDSSRPPTPITTSTSRSRSSRTTDHSSPCLKRWTVTAMANCI